ncbi:MAG: hypothetical protein K9J06_02160 [Flavobacteriales bacterium]|nr:hypothetical protein [Flavobacteriales bacterium]
MKTRISRILAPVLALAIISGVSSCTKDTNAIVRIRVVENSPNQLNPQDTVVLPVVQAEVRFYNDERVGTLWLEEIIMTNSDGVVEFTYPNPAILKYDVTHGGRSSLENFVILEQGETVEIELNLDEL